MTTYRKSMSEALNQVYLGEDNMALLKKAAGGAMQTLKMKDGKVKMDSFTASAIMQVYKAINPKNKKTMENVVNTGTITALQKLQSLAMRSIKSGYHEEVELDEKIQDIPDKKLKFYKSVPHPSYTRKEIEDEILRRKKTGDSVKEEVELDEDGHTDVASAIRKCMTVTEDAQDINSKLQTMSTEDSLPSWWTNKLAVASNDMNKMRDYIVNPVQEEVELDEAKYDLYHKDFSSAMQHSYKMAKKLHGITIDPKEIDDKVASGPRKPSEGKTNKYRLKGDKGAIQVQVYNKGGSKPFELNMYKEEVELDEVVKVGDTVKVKLNRKGKEYIEKGKVTKIEKDSIIVKHDFSRTPSRVSMKNIVKEEVELDEVAARGKKYDDSKIGVGTPVEVKDKSGKAHKGRVVKVNRKDDKVSVSIDAFKGRMVTLSRNSPQISIVREEVDLDENKGLENKSKKSGVSVGILKKVYSRGLAAYKTGHRPGTTAPQWAMARVNSFLTGGGARKADADLWKQAKGQKEEVELDEASARADAMRAMRRGKKVDPADVDTDATDDDVKAASKNIIMQLRKSVSLRGNFPVEFMDKKKVKVDAKIASAVQDKYNSMRKADDKEKFQAKIAKSYKDMLSALKEGFASDAQRKAAFASGYKEKGKKKKEEIVKEGTWALPDSPKLMAGLKKLMQKPIPLGKDGDDAIKAIGKYIGDDGLYDDLYDAGKKDGPKADARPVISGWMDREFVGSWKKYRLVGMGRRHSTVETTTILDRVGKKIKERKNG